MTTATTIRSRDGRGRPPSGEVPKIGFRPDIEGLRAIAVLFVLVWHAGVSWLPGGFVGVDVFFVVSGFLMTSILHRELVSRGRISVGDFYARRARRLIPASALTLVVTAISAYLILPETRWRDIGLDIAAAGGYVVNWRLADRSVDYLAQDTAPSPIQHFWSLSVEEQFYIFWPILLLGIGWLIARTRGSATRSTFVTLAVIGACSLAWSIYLTSADAGPAYFVTTTRLWELALGGLVALSMPFFMRMSSSVAAAIAWLGIAGIIATGFLLTSDVPFPGSVALIPTVATAMVIAAGPAAGKAGPVSIFNNKPVLWIGGCSYSMYLWHWPVLIIGGYWITDGLRDITVTEGVVLVILSVLPAWLSLRYVENPVRRWDALKDSVKNSLMLAFLGIAGCLIVGMLLALATPKPSSVVYASQYTPQTSGQAEAKPIGAELLGDDPKASEVGEAVDSVPSITPLPASAPSDNPPVYGSCHQEFASTDAIPCTFGDPSSAYTVALVGDSHAAHWVNALQIVAQERGWKLQTYTKSSCPFIDGPVLNEGKAYPECTEWNANVRKVLTGPNRPNVVFVSNLDHASPGNTSGPAMVNAMADGMTRAWEPVIAAGSKVVVLRDTPVSKFNLPECVATHTSELTACATPRSTAVTTQGQSQQIAASKTGAPIVDLTDWICPQDVCAPVIGGVLVYRDKTHLTATYSKSLGKTLNAQLPAL